MPTDHRKDIDGLRAIAILPVVIYHSGLPGVPGGYVGVDVFFVISGFLIAGIIHREIRDDRFSLLGFYERRARRILPALFFVIACSFLIATIIATPSDFKGFASSVFSTIAFTSNILFWLNTDYFSVAAEFNPLLHTWSLSVEEQFYIMFPIFMIAVASSREAYIRNLVIATFVASFALCAFATSNFPSASFYLIPTRAWELLAGVGLALGVVPHLHRQSHRTLAASGGLVMVLAAIFILDDSTKFPGIAAVLPAIGTALIIHAGSSGPTPVSRLLSLRVFVFFGLISYSLYLWHWPILAFLRLAQGSVFIEPLVGATAVLVSCFAATFSWRFIEKPFRNRHQFNRGQILAYSAAGSAALLSCAAAVYLVDGMPSRFNDRTIAIIDGSEDIGTNRWSCRGILPDDRLCTVGLKSAEPSIVFWGDSHVAALMPAADVLASSKGRSGYIAYRSACVPLLGVHRVDQANWRECREFNIAVLEFVEANRDKIDTIVLAGRWALTATSERLRDESGSRAILARDSLDTTAEENNVLFQNGLEETIRRLKMSGIRMIILGGIPEIGWDVPRRLATHDRLGLPMPQGPNLAGVSNRNYIADRILNGVASEHGVEIISIAPLLCRPDCMIIDGAKPLYVDGDHLSVHGARNVLGPLLIDILKF